MVHGSVMVGPAKNDPMSALIALSLPMTNRDLLCSSPSVPKSYQCEVILRVTDSERYRSLEPS